jgi:hypothetical protein
MSCFDIVAISYIVYMVICNFATHATCPLTLITYKYNVGATQIELQGLL